MDGLRHRHDRDGFTLMEMLIVVAIIAILIAIAIPVFNSQLEKARKATCDANCRSLTAVVRTDYMTDGTTYIDAFTKEYATCKYNCPDKGTLTCDSATGTVSCSIHSPSESSSTPFQKDDIQSLAGDMNSVLTKLLANGKAAINYSASYKGTTYPCVSLGNISYASIGGKSLAQLLTDAGLTNDKESIIKNAGGMTFLSPYGTSVLGTAYTDPNDNNKEVLIYADGSKYTVNKTKLSGQYGYYLSDKSNLP